ncbi:unnamed protein product [Amoebophrya sp. A120]|nr:unnamed protein product [Amoebophrya sp. A120]|eukprot:GSA120T00003177001.1
MSSRALTSAKLLQKAKQIANPLPSAAMRSSLSPPSGVAAQYESEVSSLLEQQQALEHEAARKTTGGTTAKVDQQAASRPSVEASEPPASLMQAGGTYRCTGSRQKNKRRARSTEFVRPRSSISTGATQKARCFAKSKAEEQSRQPHAVLRARWK